MLVVDFIVVCGAEVVFVVDVVRNIGVAVVLGA